MKLQIFKCLCARDLFSFPVDQRYEIIVENGRNVENRPIIMTVVPKTSFFGTPCMLYVFFLLNCIIHKAEDKYVFICN